MRPSRATLEEWEHLHSHARNFEIALIVLQILSLPFTVLAGIKYNFLIGGIIANILTLLVSVIALICYAKAKLHVVTSLVRSILFFLGWLIVSAIARSVWYTDYYSATNNGTIVVYVTWYYVIRSIFYWGFMVTFFIYMIFSAVAVHRWRHRRYNSRKVDEGSAYVHPQAYGYTAPPPPPPSAPY